MLSAEVIKHGIYSHKNHTPIRAVTLKSKIPCLVASFLSIALRFTSYSKLSCRSSEVLSLPNSCAFFLMTFLYAFCNTCPPHIIQEIVLWCCSITWQALQMQKTLQSIPNHLGRSRCITLPQRFICFPNLERQGLVFRPISPCCLTSF